MITSRELVEGNDKIGIRHVRRTQFRQRLRSGIDSILPQTGKKFGRDMLLGRNSTLRDLNRNVPLGRTALEKFSRDRALHRAELANQQDTGCGTRSGSSRELWA